jgi:hypothetical protein
LKQRIADANRVSPEPLLQVVRYLVGSATSGTLVLTLHEVSGTTAAKPWLPAASCGMKCDAPIICSQYVPLRRASAATRASAQLATAGCCGDTLGAAVACLLLLHLLLDCRDRCRRCWLCRPAWPCCVAGQGCQGSLSAPVSPQLRQRQFVILGSTHTTTSTLMPCCRCLPASPGTFADGVCLAAICRAAVGCVEAMRSLQVAPA